MKIMVFLGFFPGVVFSIVGGFEFYHPMGCRRPTKRQPLPLRSEQLEPLSGLKRIQQYHTNNGLYKPPRKKNKPSSVNSKGVLGT